jgi:hypothetical protein
MELSSLAVEIVALSASSEPDCCLHGRNEGLAECAALLRRVEPILRLLHSLDDHRRFDSPQSQCPLLLRVQLDRDVVDETSHCPADGAFETAHPSVVAMATELLRCELRSRPTQRRSVHRVPELGRRNWVRTDRLDDPERPNVFQRSGSIRTKEADSHSLIVSQRGSIIARSLERNMAYFPAELLKCVVFLGYKDQDEKFHFAGSAFWVSRAGPEDIKNEYRPAYLVTAAHVIDKVQTSGVGNRVWVRINTKGGNQDSFDTPLASWRGHSDGNVDIAVMKIGVGDNFDHATWPLELCVINSEFDTPESGNRKIELGDEISFAGLFYPRPGQRRNLPIVRIGTVAALREEPVLGREGRPMDVYLVESQSIGGLSGSPVFIDVRTAQTTSPPEWGYTPRADEASSPVRFRLLGLIHGHFGIDDVADAIADDGKEKIHINMGIAMVVPAEKILETLAGYASEEEIEANDFRERMKARTINVADASVQQPNVTIGVFTTSSESRKD